MRKMLNKDQSIRSYKEGEKGAFVSIAVNTVLSILKLFAGLLGNSSAMIADALHSFSDVVSSVAVWIGMKVAGKPADKNHPWGHGKAEAIAAKIVAVILVIVGFEIGIDAIHNISQSDFIPVKPIALWAAVISIIVKEWNFQYAWRMGKRLNSVSLKADAWHHRSDAISSAAAFIGIAFTIYGGDKWRFMDHLAAVFVGAMIVWVGIKLFRDAAAVLMDEKIPEDKIEEIKRSLLETEGVLGVEALAGRKAGLELLIVAHVEVDPEISVLESHEIASQARDDLMNKYPEIKNVLVHIEPYYPGDHKSGSWELEKRRGLMNEE